MVKTINNTLTEINDMPKIDSPTKKMAKLRYDMFEWNH